jgi:mono/diheme cytochrome c family protein
MKKILTGSILAAILSLNACSYNRNPDSGNYDPNDPGFVYEFEGDMYYSVPYDALSQWEHHQNPYNRDSLNMRMPAKGTVARGKAPYYYSYPNSIEGYEAAGREVKNTLNSTSASQAEGKRLFETYCWQCHGKDGVPQGSIVAAGKFPPPTWDFGRLAFLKTLPEGKMYHTITYGRNLMGSHASQLSPDQRWMIIDYLKNVAANTAAPAPAEGAASADSTKAPGAAKGTASKMEAPAKDKKTK